MNPQGDQKAGRAGQPFGSSGDGVLFLESGCFPLASAKLLLGIVMAFASTKCIHCSTS